jgi:hypothetical protein
MDLAHLRPEVRELARLPATERLARVPANRWIGYGRASQAVALLERLLASEPVNQHPIGTPPWIRGKPLKELG